MGWRNEEGKSLFSLFSTEIHFFFICLTKLIRQTSFYSIFLICEKFVKLNSHLKAEVVRLIEIIIQFQSIS